MWTLEDRSSTDPKARPYRAFPGWLWTKWGPAEPLRGASHVKAQPEGRVRAHKSTGTAFVIAAAVGETQNNVGCGWQDRQKQEHSSSGPVGHGSGAFSTDSEADADRTVDWRQWSSSDLHSNCLLI